MMGRIYLLNKVIAILSERMFTNEKEKRHNQRLQATQSVPTFSGRVDPRQGWWFFVDWRHALWALEPRAVRRTMQQIIEGMTYSPVLYKYREFNEYSLRLISSNELFFSSPSRLNDPRDCQLPIRYEKGTKKQIYKKNLELLKANAPRLTKKQRKLEAARVAKKVYIDKEKPHRIKAMRKALNEHTSRTIGVLSLSAVPDHPLMWAHYAGGNTGFCVGFDTRRLLRFCDLLARQGIYIQDGNVMYYDALPEINPYRMTVPEMVRASIFSKSEHWAYEEEVRLVCWEHPDYVLPIDSRIIISVVLGARCAPDDERKLIEILKSRETKVDLFRAVYEDSDSSVALREVKYA